MSFSVGKGFYWQLQLTEGSQFEPSPKFLLTCLTCLTCLTYLTFLTYLTCLTCLTCLTYLNMSFSVGKGFYWQLQLTEGSQFEPSPKLLLSCLTCLTCLTFLICQTSYPIWHILPVLPVLPVLIVSHVLTCFFQLEKDSTDDYSWWKGLHLSYLQNFCILVLLVLHV
jgi:hypothetical protein